jgi:hypothetical protein
MGEGEERAAWRGEGVYVPLWTRHSVTNTVLPRDFHHRPVTKPSQSVTSRHKEGTRKEKGEGRKEKGGAGWQFTPRRPTNMAFCVNPHSLPVEPQNS